MKALLLSVRPEHAIKILKGEKTLELRKSVPKGFKGWVYVYVTKGKSRLSVVHDDESGKTYYYLNSNWGRELNGTIPFRFWFDEYIAYEYYADDNIYFAKRPQDLGYNADEVLKHLCLTREQFKWYGNRKDLYAWHIKNLDIFSEPMKLGELQNYMPKDTKIPEWAITSSWQIHHAPLEKAPQSYMYVYVKEE